MKSFLLKLVILLTCLAGNNAWSITVDCSPNGFGNGECIFINDRDQSGSICVQLKLTSTLIGMTAVSREICSGVIEPGKLIQRSFSNVFDIEPRHYCIGFGETSWTDNCVYVTKTVKEEYQASDSSSPVVKVASIFVIILIALVLIFQIFNGGKVKKNVENANFADTEAGNRSNTRAGEEKFMLSNLDDDAYVIYLVDKYKIEEKSVLHKFAANGKLFSSVNDALTYCDDLEKSTHTKLADMDYQIINDSKKSIHTKLADTDFQIIHDSKWSYRINEDGTVDVKNQYGGIKTYENLDSAKNELKWWV